MKIIHLISGGDVGGAKTHVLSLLSGLIRTEEIRLVCFTDGPFADEARALGIDTVIMNSRNLPAVARALTEMIRREGFQIVHCHGARANLMGAMVRRRARVPVVTTVHSDYRLDYLGRPFHRLTYGTINTVALRLLDYHIGVSDAMAALLISRGFDPQTMFAIYNGVEFREVTPAMDRETYFRSIGLKTEPDSVVFGIAARLSAVKDVATLVRGFARAAKERPSIRLVVAGDGEQSAELRALAAQLCPPDSYCFAGWVSDMDSFYRAIDVNTLTSLSETFPYALTEGARERCATIASRVGGVPDLIEHGVTGLLFEARDDETLSREIVLLASDAALRERLGSALWEKASRDFSADATVEKQKEIYRVILRREARNPGRRDGVLICGAYGKGNAGDDAILEAIIRQMRSIDPDLPLCVLTRTPKETRVRYRIGAVHTFDFPGFLRIMRRTKLYLNGGGSLIQDVTSSRSLQYYLFSIRCAKAAGNRVLMYGCGIGPIGKPRNVRRAARVIDRCVDAVTLREDTSLGELRRMGVTRPALRVTADPALLLQPAGDDRAEGFFLANGLDPNGRYLMLVLRPWKGFEERAAAFANAADLAAEKYGLTPLFLAFEPTRDLPSCRMAAELTRCGGRVLAAPDDGSLLVAIMRRMQAVVSMRLHALIFATAVDTPVVGAVYDPKVKAFLDYMGQKRYLSLDEITPESLWRETEAALTDSSDRSDMIGRLRALASENEAEARRLLEE